jgi:hypothetical protein
MSSTVEHLSESKIEGLAQDAVSLADCKRKARRVTREMLSLYFWAT